MWLFLGAVLLVLSHCFASYILPIADCDETFNFLEPMHFLMYGSGLQTWENCPRFALRSWFFSWLYVGPITIIGKAVSIYNPSGLRNIDVYFLLRAFSGVVTALSEIFFVGGVRKVFGKRVAAAALTLLLFNYPITHAAVSILPTSYAMINYFVAVGCWLRTDGSLVKCITRVEGKVPSRMKRSVMGGSQFQAINFAIFGTVFSVVSSTVIGWPFAALLAVPMALDMLVRFPLASTVSLLLSLAVVVPLSVYFDTLYYNGCHGGNGKITWSALNLVRYNMFMGGEGRGPELYGVEPWYFFFKNLLLNAHLMFVACLLSPFVVLLKPSTTSWVSNATTNSDEIDAGETTGEKGRKTQKSPTTKPDTRPVEPTVSRGRGLLYISPFFLWFAFWLTVSHKEERFMSPAFPFLALAAALSFTHLTFAGPARSVNSENGAVLHSASTRAEPSGRRKQLPGCWLQRMRHTFFLTTGCIVLSFIVTVSLSRTAAIHKFYVGPQQKLYDNYATVRELARRKASDAPQKGEKTLYTLCVGREWYRFPSSFFLDPLHARIAFIRSPGVDCAMPLPFASGDGNATCQCGAEGVNDLNKAIPEQFVQDVAKDCDAVFDTVSPNEDDQESADFPRDVFKYEIGEGQTHWLLDAERTPMWCRVLYYPLGVSERCVSRRRVVLLSKQNPK
ncbi:Alg9-like mannosyltransferase, putative [Trypanosoma brucei gambiense DAL972]|uniref:Mannosyltransferase n=1 Tax=Trypanosoma brucei gambiense (strain MHOM/CI/86/DAL972) TaxID=679716 RepID=C9ZQC6_TRYB9|nr:Alg9-like mannosyltransferase, putative [Trypanosoma brucei gambiense DAL972]CBH11606.1 Alg9-like mannosyltransferase, putative [Trypanosoma brucei gambiense DAL972]|eukprot:XP_011773891.1 Alg9-like mannosyltransferase, putative [Trypanosoma brucei gambiense DAL972]